MTVFGEPVIRVESGVYAVTYPVHLSQQTVEMIQRAWRREMPNARLIVFDGGAQLTPLMASLPDAGTPIYDQLIAGSPGTKRKESA